jgi:CRISPR system Cascade subunit CasB
MTKNNPRLKISSPAASVTGNVPALSIVVVAWNVAPYIGQAIRSCYQLPEDRCEILVIENASTDGTRGEIDAAIAGHRNVRLVVNDRNIGLGPARNQGVAEARGEYVAFLDGDDWFAPDALEPILAAARDHDADVAVFEYNRFRMNGTLAPIGNTRRLSQIAPNPRKNRRLAAAAFHVAWNKLYRRAFLVEHGFAFSNGFYEDLEWTYPVLMSAQNILRLPIAGIVYRQRRGSILNSMDPRHLEVIDRLRSLAAFLHQHPERVEEWWREFLVRRVVRQIVVILRFPHRLDWRHKVKLARLASPMLAEFDPNNRFAPKRWSARLIYRLLRRGHARLAVIAVRLLANEPGIN